MSAPSAATPDGVFVHALADVQTLFGARAHKVLALAAAEPALAQVFGTTPAASVVYATREEMAMMLSDVIFRRTELGNTGALARSELLAVARLMATERGWGMGETALQVEHVIAHYRRVSMAGDA